VFGRQYRTTLKVIAYEHDWFGNALTIQQVYEYSTGDSDFIQFLIVAGDNTAHDLHIADPAYLLESIAGQMTFP